MEIKRGSRVEHRDTTYACYGTVVGFKTEGALVLWDNIEEDPPVEPGQVQTCEPLDAIKVIG